jgi:hypothetical protein
MNSGVATVQPLSKETLERISAILHDAIVQPGDWGFEEAERKFWIGAWVPDWTRAKTERYFYASVGVACH